MNSQKWIRLLNKAFLKEETKQLLRKDWLEINAKSGIPSTGHCYVATESLFYLMGGTKSDFRPVCAVYEEGTHWWLVDSKGNILDPTRNQYDQESPPYHLGKRCGFPNGYKKPSRL
jgi:hypothetical protein